MRTNEKLIERLQNTPRPHYLIRIDEFYQEGVETRLSGAVLFHSKNNPSVKDRTTKYVHTPHVNASDALHTLWNATHIIAEERNYDWRIAVGPMIITPKSIIPPDTELVLEVVVQELGIVKGTNKGTMEGRIHDLTGKELIHMSARYLAKR